MGDNIHDCCRICLDVESDHISIFQDPTILLHVKSCLSMNISANDNLPKRICLSCVSQLSEFYNFQLNARCSQDWLESSIEEKTKKTSEIKMPLQPLPDSEYNSDSLLEFLNNTANIEEYLNNLGKEDIPSIVNMLDRNNENTIEAVSKTPNNIKSTKLPSPKKKDSIIKPKTRGLNMEIDVLDSDIDIVKEILMKETEPKIKTNQIKTDKPPLSCFACRSKFDSIQKLSQHLSICDNAARTCIHCNMLFDSKHRMLQHRLTHNTSPSLTCSCGEQFLNKEKLIQHYRICSADNIAVMGCVHRCKQCGEVFKDRFLLYKHARGHVLKAEERICDICGHSFIGNEALSKHRKEEHEKPDNLLYRCKVCNLTSADRKEIYVHVQKHTTKQELNRHLCESCGRSFATRATLIRHSLQHGKFRTYNATEAKTPSKSLVKNIELTICEKCGQTVNSCKLDAHFCL